MASVASSAPVSRNVHKMKQVMNVRKRCWRKWGCLVEVEGKRVKEGGKRSENELNKYMKLSKDNFSEYQNKIESKCLIARNVHETDVIFIGIDSVVLIYILQNISTPVELGTGRIVG